MAFGCNLESTARDNKVIVSCNAMFIVSGNIKLTISIDNQVILAEQGSIRIVFVAGKIGFGIGQTVQASRGKSNFYFISLTNQNSAAVGAGNGCTVQNQLNRICFVGVYNNLAII